jgi:adenylyltransferase/sulfurtransferase
VGEPLVGKLLLYDALDMSFQTVQLRKNPRCKICGESPQITGLIDYEQFCGVPARGHRPVTGIAEVSPRESAQRLAQGQGIGLLDVREAVEQQIATLPGAVLIPWGQIQLRMKELDKNVEWIVYCRSGVRSARAAATLQEAGYRVINMRGGINAWADEVEPGMRKY